MPSPTDWKQEIGPFVRIGQIILAAMIFGCVTFGVIALVMSGQVGGGDAGGPQSLMTYMAIGFAVMAVAARAVVGVVVTANGRRKIAKGTWQLTPGPRPNPQLSNLIEQFGDVGRLLAVYQARLIVTAALLEAPAFFLLIAHLIEGTSASLIVAAAMVVGLVLQFPTQGRVADWVESQLQIIEQQRSFGGQ